MSKPDPFERNTKLNDVQSVRKVQSIPAIINSELYRPMRMQFDTHLLDALSTEYPDHIAYVRNKLLPSVQNFWAETLSVIPATNIEVPFLGRCAAEVKQLTGVSFDDFLQYNTPSDGVKTISNIGSGGNVEMSLEGDSLVYNDKDLVVIVIPVEGTSICPEGQGIDSSIASLAFATNCQNDQIDRPTVGYTGICFGPLDITTENSTKIYQRQLLTLSHEFTHILVSLLNRVLLPLTKLFNFLRDIGLFCRE